MKKPALKRAPKKPPKQERHDPKEQSLAAFLLELPKIEGHDDLFERIEDDAPDRDVFD